MKQWLLRVVFLLSGSLSHEVITAGREMWNCCFLSHSSRKILNSPSPLYCLCSWRIRLCWFQGVRHLQCILNFDSHRHPRDGYEVSWKVRSIAERWAAKYLHCDDDQFIWMHGRFRSPVSLQITPGLSITFRLQGNSRAHTAKPLGPLHASFPCNANFQTHLWVIQVSRMPPAISWVLSRRCELLSSSLTAVQILNRS